jgi:hypothetical protein
MPARLGRASRCCGITPVGAAIASAIDDALQKPGAVTQLPVTPMRLKALMDRALSVPPV